MVTGVVECGLSMPSAGRDGGSLQTGRHGTVHVWGRRSHGLINRVAESEEKGGEKIFN